MSQWDMGHLPENILQHIQGQWGGTEHNKQTLFCLAVRWSELFQRRQVDICLNPGHWGESRKTLEDTKKPTGQILYCPHGHG